MDRDAWESVLAASCHHVEEAVRVTGSISDLPAGVEGNYVQETSGVKVRIGSHVVTAEVIFAVRIAVLCVPTVTIVVTGNAKIGLVVE